MHSNPEYKYFDYSGDNGYYDCSDEAIMDSQEMKGWPLKDDVLKCDECSGEQNE